MKIAFRHLPFTQEQNAHIEELAKAAGLEPIWYPNGEMPTVEELKDCEVLMGYFPPAMMKELPNLKWLQTPAAGVDKLCGDLYANDDVVLTNCSGAFGVAIAEYMMTGLLMLMRLMPAYMDNQKQTIWKCMGQCRAVYGSTITVVGMGDIGSRFAHIAKAMGATIRGVRRTKGEIPADFDEVYTSDELAEAVKGVDAVVMALPGTPATRGLVSREVIAAMDPKTIVVNCGRGFTMDEEALIEALQAGKLAGAVLDVTAVEPLDPASPLWQMENVIVTPHISGHDDDPVNYQFMYQIMCENLTRYAAGQPLTHVVDRTRGY